ncbi:DNA polymerase III subunit delta [Poseidonocella sp. HB161398]|uniref:DNA polymerase III subunit delta n=1 Tax=Poseidonocella sp. HB161398 TaxID=2320855 RepID=UPI0011084D28|nr:DNA polymerase III subunit delta [Poseidonocella sp. HB161398]
MKLSTREAAGYLARPDPSHAGILIYGADPMRVSLKRREIVAALLGKENDLGLTRIAAGDLRREPSLANDALKERSMFASGQRVVLVEDATDGLQAPIAAALADHAQGDAYLVVIAGALNARSKLRKAFESHPNALALGVYDDPPSRAEIEAQLAREGLRDLSREAMEALSGLSRALDPGDFGQVIAKLGLYKQGDATPVTPQEIADMAPLTQEADLDDLLHVVAEARVQDIGPLLRRLETQGIQPVAIAIGATRHFRTLHAAAADPGGVQSGLSRVKPPVFGPRRDRMARQAQGWGLRRLEQALTVLIDTDLSLRSAATAPPMAVMERALIRLAMMGRR